MILNNDIADNTVKERLKKYLKSKNISQTQFTKKIGVSKAFISSMRTSMQPDKIESIALKFPDLNIKWLVTGEGNMLNTDKNNVFVNGKTHNTAIDNSSINNITDNENISKLIKILQNELLVKNEQINKLIDKISN